MLAGASVELPECPPTSDIIRGKVSDLDLCLFICLFVRLRVYVVNCVAIALQVFSSGWVIEPILQDGHLYSMVSYLSQVTSAIIYSENNVQFLLKDKAT